MNYYGIFYIENESTSTLPVKIESITITPPLADWPTNPPYGFTGNVTFDGGTKTLAEVIGEQIDPGQSKDGIVNVGLDSAGVGSDFDFTIEVEVEP